MFNCQDRSRMARGPEKSCVRHDQESEGDLVLS